MITRRHFTIMLAALPFAAAKTEVARAQAYPAKPIRFVVPFPAGGSTDVGARLIAENLARAFGQQVYVENKSGANGTIGIEDAAKSAPDGYTVLVTIDTVASNPHVFHPTSILQRSFADYPDFPSTHRAGGSPLARRQLARRIDCAGKKQPGLPYATGSGVGSPQHMAVQWFAQIAGIKLEQVPVSRRRAGDQRSAGWPRQARFARIDAADAALQGRHVALVGANTKTRSPSLPDVPTYEEAGMTGLVLDQWLGVFAPAGTPPELRTASTARSTRRFAIRWCARVFSIRRRSRSVEPPNSSPPRSRRLCQVREAGEGFEYQVRVARQANAIFDLSSRPDGSGSRLRPAGPFVAGAHAELTLVYTAGTFGIDDTGMLKISWRTTSDMSKPQFDKPQAANFTTVEASNGAKLEVWFDRLNVRPFANTLSDSGRARLSARRRYADGASGRPQAGLAGLPAADQCRSECGAENLGRCVCDLRIL